MGLKCSILGHTYGESTVERDREEQGSEVVITIQETETCTRCGNTRVVSENKEVTAIETPSDIAGDVVEEDDDEAVETAQESQHTGDDEHGSDGNVDATTEPSPAPPGEDDAEIMDSGDSTESGDAELDEPSTTVPDAEDSTAPDPDPEEDDAVILDETDGEDTERAPGEWPEEAAGETADEESGDDEWEPVSADAEHDDGPDVEPLGGTAVTVPEGQFRCPECGFTTDVEASSLRAGDFCPECQKGALVTETSE
jgi:ssDNA-binding Zn-finger/Zn-ribbon topoisomerase 1